MTPSGRRRNMNMFEIVKKAIDEWDPEDLLPPSLPGNEDEYDSESKRIALKIDKESSANDIAHIISKVFIGSFSDSKLFRYENCIEVANKIWSEMSRYISAKV
jgi:hypothetical protein